jgi:hypothetical protein
LDRLVAPEFTLRVADVPQSSLPRTMWMDNLNRGCIKTPTAIADRKQAFRVMFAIDVRRTTSQAKKA